jgi:3-deoxy-7-phosphoheptulonate synthase
MHPEPEKALSDGMQSLYPQQFGEMMNEVRRVAGAIDRKVAAISSR